jgi:hypothetical protein
MRHAVGRRWSPRARLFIGFVALAVAAGTATVALAAAGDEGSPAELSAFVSIEDVAPNVVTPPVGDDGSTGVFTVECGTNANRKFNADNPVAQPGVKNGAQHIHDYVGNLSINADSTDESLEASDTTCTNGDKSAYFWPVVRINTDANTGEEPTGEPAISCPTVADRLPAVPQQARAEVDQNLALLDKQITDASRRLTDPAVKGDPNFVNNAVLGPLMAKRVATLDRIAIAIAIGRNAPRPTGLESLAACTLGNSGGDAEEPDELPGPQGPDFEIGGNVGTIVQPASVLIEYRGNAASEVVPMPKFLRALTGESKPTSRGPANARPSWTCSGFTDRLTDKYVICPEGSQVLRVHDFASCWDGQNTDSANHRDHLRFPDAKTGACPEGTQAVPQLRITIAYDIPADVQQKGQYQLDAFDEENHNPASDHDDFLNVNSEELMAEIAGCVNAGRRCA